MSSNDVIHGYLDVKISSKSRRGLTPWKAWQKQWCEIKRLEDINNGVELTLKSSSDGSTLSSLVLPRSSTICRTESRTKQYAFGVFTMGRNQKPLLFLSGVSESDSQEWMSSIRKMLCVASYLPVGKANFRVSLVDNDHSRASGLVGLHGVLGTNTQEIVISDPCTAEPKITWKWYQFHQFHLQASAHSSDEKMICVMHTSSDFPTGPGQLYFYCKQAPTLLEQLVSRGKTSKSDSSLISSKRLSRSEGDLCVNNSNRDSKTGPICFGSYNGSDDSGVRVSVGSDDSGGCGLKGKATSASLFSLGLGILTKTPGGSETNGDSVQDLSLASNITEQTLPRPESGVSLASGIYEEISDAPPEKTKKTDANAHIYENLDEVVLKKLNLEIKPDPPPLPRRNVECGGNNGFSTLRPKMINKILSPYKQRCNTLPARDLTRISQIFTSESEYVVMSPTKNNNAKHVTTECVYVPMSPVVGLKAKIETCYMVMNGKKT